MKHEPGFADETHAYLDGDTPGVAENDRGAVKQLSEAIAAYVEGQPVPGPEVDRAVMAVIRTDGRAKRQRGWRWFIQPQEFRLRPVLAAATILVAAAVVGNSLTRTDSAITPQARGASTGESTVLVRFELRAPDASGVTLAGSFNDWDNEATPLLRGSAPGIWTVTVPLIPGEHQYLFVIDGQEWIPDPRAHAQVDDGFGQRNSVIVVGPRGVVRS